MFNEGFKHQYQFSALIKCDLTEETGAGRPGEKEVEGRTYCSLQISER